MSLLHVTAYRPPVPHGSSAAMTMTSLLYCYLKQTGFQKRSFSIIRLCIRNIVSATQLERLKSKLFCTYPLKRLDLCPHSTKAHQQTFNMNSMLQSDPAVVNNKESRNWYRSVTIQQSSKNNEENILTFNIHVLDTYPEDFDQKRNTIVAVHGIPGSGKDFESLATRLHERGIRLVAPTSLGMLESPITMNMLKEIDFSTEGRTRTLELVLKAMGIHRIDMMIGHSAGAWAMYKAGASWENVRSLFGFNPVGASPNRTMRPFALIKLIAASLHWSVARFFILPFMVQVYRLIGFRDVKSDGTYLVAAQQYVTCQGFSDVPVNAALIRKRKLPVLFAYTLNDTIVEPAICANMAYHVLGIPMENTVTYSDDKTPSRYPFFVPQGWLTRCLVFARGGHIVHIAHEKEIVEQIDNLLKHLAAAKDTNDLTQKSNV